MNFNEYYFTEALSNELMTLKRYLTMGDEEKAINRAMAYPHLIDKFLEEEGYNTSKFKNFNKKEDYEKVDFLYKKDLNLVMKYGEYVHGKREYYNNSEVEFYDLADYRRFIRQKWLIHFSNRAEQIAKDQNFKYGIPYEDYQRLGLSTHFKDITKTGGFNFAYDVDDVEKYYYSERGGIPKYGKEVVIFKGDGIKIYHVGDEEPQVVYDGKSTNKPIIYVEFEDGKWIIKSTKTGEKLIINKSIEAITRWVDTNYAQYRKHLEP